MWTIYDSKMRKISQWGFVDGHRHGPSMWWYAKGHTMREAHFRDGDLDGEYVEWSPEGGVRVNETHQAGRKLAAKTTFHANGKKKTEDIYLFAKDVEQTPDDWWNCKLQVTVKSGHDEKHGASAAWHPGGQRQLEGLFEHDAQVGQFTWWHANGQKALEGRYLLGKQDGVWIWWHANGQKAINGQYANGTPTGRWTWWKEDGQVAQSADLSNSEGIAIDMPRTLDPDAAPRPSNPPTAAAAVVSVAKSRRFFRSSWHNPNPPGESSVISRRCWSTISSPGQGTAKSGGCRGPLMA